MPVSVSVPTKIRVDPAALAEHPCRVEEAISAAVGRALANSRQTVLDARGGFVGVCLHPPTFTWSGLPLKDQDRAQLEETVSDLVDKAAQRELISGSTEVGVAGVLREDPYEFYDDERGSRFLGLYTLDTYDGGKVDLAVSGKKPPKLSADPIEIVKIFYRIDDWEAQERLNLLVGQATAAQPLGIIYRVAVPGFEPGWQVAVTVGKPDEVAGTLWFPDFMSQRFLGFNADPMFKKVRFIPPVGAATAEIIELPSDPDARKRTYKDLFGEDLVQKIRRWSPKKVSMTTPKYNEAIADAVAREIARALAEIGDRVAALVVRMSGASVVLFLTREQRDTFGWTGTAQLELLTVFGPGTATGKDKKLGARGGTGTESWLQFPPESGGTGDCPRDEIPQDKWGGFLNEPALEEIGDAGVEFGSRMAEIAAELGIEQGKYPGEFCCRAAAVLAAKAHAVTSMDESGIGENTAAAGGGNLGPIDFTPGESTIIATIRGYAGVLVKISRLAERINDTYTHKEYACAIHGMYRGRGSGWSLHFLEELIPTMRWVVYHLFVSGCRSMLIQLLVTSENEIKKRKDAMDRYAPLFEKWILPEITDLAEIETLKRKLDEHQLRKFMPAPGTALMPGVAEQDWLLATNALVGMLCGPTILRVPGGTYDVVSEGGVDRIRGSTGVLWSKDDLVQALSMKRGNVEGIDPLVKQITDTPEAVKRFKGSTAIRAELEKLLAEMLEDNHEMQFNAGNQPMYGFGASQRVKDTPNATVQYSSFRLTGVHLLTHKAIGDAFAGRRIYATGIDFLFGSEEGKAALKGFGLMVGMIALSVLVPGGGFLAFGAGVATAKHEMSAADEKKRLYRALIDPDLVLSHAEVEVARFVAQFGFAVSLIPGAGTATRSLIGSGKAILRGEAKALGTLAGRAVAKAAAKDLAEYAVKDLLEAFVKETVMNVVMDQIITQLLTPIIEDLHKQAEMIRPSGGSGADDDGEQAFIVMIRSSQVP